MSLLKVELMVNLLIYFACIGKNIQRFMTALSSVDIATNLVLFKNK